MVHLEETRKWQLEVMVTLKAFVNKAAKEDDL